MARRRRQIDRAPGVGLGLDARHRCPRHSPGRDAGNHPRRHRPPPRPAGHARGDTAGDAAPRFALRHRTKYRRRRSPAPAAIRTSAIPSICSAKAHAPAPTPTNISTLTRTRSPRSALTPAMRRASPTLPSPACGGGRGAGHFGQALGAASALRSDIARARACRADAASVGACSPRQEPRSPVHSRRRRGRSPGIVAGSDRRRAERSIARRLGRLWPCRAGLSKTGFTCDRMDRRCRRGKKSPAHRPVGQGRLLGHRDQARAGTRPDRLSGLHPQGHDRPLLHGLRQKIARGPHAALSAIRHP